MPRLSVIIPVRRARGQLRECLESVLGQSFTDIEVIGVDDGAPDGSGLLLDEFAARDSRVQAIHLLYGGGRGRAAQRRGRAGRRRLPPLPGGHLRPAAGCPAGRRRPAGRHAATPNCCCSATTGARSGAIPGRPGRWSCSANCPRSGSPSPSTPSSWTSRRSPGTAPCAAPSTRARKWPSGRGRTASGGTRSRPSPRPGPSPYSPPPVSNTAAGAGFPFRPTGRNRRTARHRTTSSTRTPP